mgnify:CR=1 FL=1
MLTLSHEAGVPDPLVSHCETKDQSESYFTERRFAFSIPLDIILRNIVSLDFVYICILSLLATHLILCLVSSVYF